MAGRECPADRELMEMWACPEFLARTRPLHREGFEDPWESLGGRGSKDLRASLEWSDSPG